MRGRKLLAWIALVTATMAGCETTREQIKPAPPPEALMTPPTDDPRYTEPPRYPKSVLNQGRILRGDGGAAAGGPGGGMMGAGAGAGAGMPGRY